MPSPRRRSRPPVFLAAVAALLILPLSAVRAAEGPDRLVVYCAHDATFADQVLRAFEKRAGIRVDIRYDTEATKSLGLVELILREREHPRCDVFWNNQVLGTVELKEQGLLLPYKGSGYERIPAGMKDPDGCWTGFAARMRVYIVNTAMMESSPEAVEKLLAGPDLSRVTIAKPLYGTTFTHYTALWTLLGPDTLKAWHADCRRRGIREAGGNAQTKQLVAGGACALGLTDTDDYFQAKDEGRPVAMLPVRVGPKKQTILIPNTVCIVKGTQRLKAAQQLADYLLSAETELALANSAARQAPLGPVNEDRLSADVKPLRAWAADALPLDADPKPARDCRAWLKAEYLEK